MNGGYENAHEKLMRRIRIEDMKCLYENLERKTDLERRYEKERS